MFARSTLLAALPILTLASPPIAAQAPSPPPGAIDCAKPRSAGQQLICADKDLAGLDVALAQTANAARPKLAPTVEEARRFGEEHLRFRNFLETCLKAPSPPDCIAHNYRVRTTELQVAGGLAADPPPIAYRCSDDRDLEIRFYTSTATPAVVLTRDGAGGGMAFADLGKPGTYVGPEVTLAEGVGGASKIRWRGTELTCRRK